MERARLDGTHRTVILNDIGRVYGFSIDYALEKIYWADMDNHVIESASLDGESCYFYRFYPKFLDRYGSFWVAERLAIGLDKSGYQVNIFLISP